ncbi:replication restart helicase PriA [Aureibacter tunicatorum]|uniref:Replication restart protein PriA n=1 Tax=Aureibacter tunicatorum TaxID=866807 RepID=A0AAE3XPL5_9BACT|nr:primosomal protein N' [Aureibacter tunicatorum]MDR6239783.1 primosomal protein N' (replication factor Y) [Aureibacter tunicatorum]BDD04258.1 primosomal protein N' [Aureibacter tunicatorum]
MRFADLILPVPIPRTFTYEIPFELEGRLMPGHRVIVEFGKSKILTAIVSDIHNSIPKYETKTILDILDEKPIITPLQLKFFFWVADYYMSNIGDVLNAAIPSGLKLSSESKIQLHQNFDFESNTFTFTERETLILNQLKTKEDLSYNEIQKLLGIKAIHKIIKSLINKEAVQIFESLKDKYKPKFEKRIRLTSHYMDVETNLEELFDQLEKTPKQLQVVLSYLQKVPIFKDSDLNNEGVPRKEILNLKDISTSSLNTLIKKKVFEQFEVQVDRVRKYIKKTKDFQLSPAQEIAKEQILNVFSQNKTCLLHGVTGSGKTEIYINLIQEAIQNESQTLLILPEIALTAQIVNRLKDIFGEKLGVYHSKYNDHERVEIWRKVLEEEYSVIIGVRSAIFLPFTNLNLIIVDECHDSSYKQFDPPPRYNGADSAIVLAKLHHSKILLGSATPSVEQYYNVQIGNYGLATLQERYSDGKLPEMTFINMKDCRNKKKVTGEYSNELIGALKLNLQNNQQSLLFQNKRGYSPYLACDECNYIPMCNSCDVNLVYYKHSNSLKCNYCGYMENIPHTCPNCGSNRIKLVGYGTEKIEEDLKLMLPEARIERLDQDSTKNKYNHEKIIQSFENGNIDILIGTQMISKGLDFDNVSLVGVLDADRILYNPDFRANERAFQLFTQLRGRAGRKSVHGQFYIQCFNENHHVFDLLKSDDYMSMYYNELKERQKFDYPPFYRLVKVMVKDRDKNISRSASIFLYNELRNLLGSKRAIGYFEPLISRVRNMYIHEITIKLERNGLNMSSIKNKIKSTEGNLYKQREFSRVRISYDVDPI